MCGNTTMSRRGRTGKVRSAQIWSPGVLVRQRPAPAYPATGRSSIVQHGGDAQVSSPPCPAIERVQVAPARAVPAAAITNPAARLPNREPRTRDDRHRLFGSRINPGREPSINSAASSGGNCAKLWICAGRRPTEALAQVSNERIEPRRIVEQAARTLTMNPAPIREEYPAHAPAAEKVLRRPRAARRSPARPRSPR